MKNGSLFKLPTLLLASNTALSGAGNGPVTVFTVYSFVYPCILSPLTNVNANLVSTLISEYNAVSSLLITLDFRNVLDELSFQ